MELRQLEYFVTLARERHFTRAAGRVRVAQSSLSSSIRALERELGSELFTRSTRRVELTEAGRALLPAAEQALAAAEDGRDAVAAVRGLLRGQLTIGLIQSLGMINVPSVLARFHRRYPQVTFKLRHDGVPALAAATAAGELDVAFVDRPLGEVRLTERPLGTENLVLVVPSSDALAGRARIRLTDLADREFVEYRADSALRARLDATCRRVGLRRRMCCEVDTLPDLVELVAQGMGISLLPQQAAAGFAGRVVTLDTLPAIPRELLAITPPDRPPTPAVAALLELLP